MQYLKRLNNLKLILLLGLLVGWLDICSAFLDYYFTTGNGPGGVLRFIASGVFGTKAFSKNGEMILWGLSFHFFIAYSFTVFFYWLYPKIKWFPSQIIFTAILYGIFIWLVMNLVVLPLSAIPKHPLHFKEEIKAILILVFMIGFPISLTLKKYYANTRKEKYLWKLTNTKRICLPVCGKQAFTKDFYSIKELSFLLPSFLL